MNIMQVPSVALVGPKNVGKSTLFNRLTCTNSALISSDSEGFTRDRRYGYVQYKTNKFVVIDTGGFDTLSNTGMQNSINAQTVLAIKESDIILFVVNGKYWEPSSDYSSIKYLQKLKKNICVVINKIDDIKWYHQRIYNMYDCHNFGIKDIIPVSAIHGHGINNLLEKVSIKISQNLHDYVQINESTVSKNVYNDKNFNKNIKYSSIKSNYIKLAIAGRPNSGKSTFVNFISRADRMITSSIPGTTRDSICVPVIYDNHKYILIDTAGIRRKNRINNIAERISVIKTLSVFKDVHVTLFMIDINEGIVDQDLSLLRFILSHSRSLIIVVNKYDTPSMITMRKRIRELLVKKINFLNFSNIHFISALHGIGIDVLFRSIQETYKSSIKILSTSRLMRIMQKSIAQYPPPAIRSNTIVGGIIPKLKYVHIGGYNPIIIVVHGIKVSQLPNGYRRYLKKCFYRSLKLQGVLLHIRFKDTYNPFIKKINKIKCC